MVYIKTSTIKKWSLSTFKNSKNQNLNETILKNKILRKS